MLPAHASRPRCCLATPVTARQASSALHRHQRPHQSDKRVRAHSMCCNQQAAARQQHPPQASPTAPHGFPHGTQKQKQAASNTCCSGEDPCANEACPGRKLSTLSSRLAAPSTVQYCLDIPALRCLPMPAQPEGLKQAGSTAGCLPQSFQCALLQLPAVVLPGRHHSPGKCRPASHCEPATQTVMQ